MRRFVVGTAGHVDHGKTTLVAALTGVDTDRLPEEKRRGITIELGFAHWQLAPDLSVSIIDVPGHRRLVHTMIAGAVGMEVVLVVVAADEGVMPQTREHLAACELLGIRRAVVALTKVDRVERDLAELAGEEVSELLTGRFEHEVVLVSAKSGEGMTALGQAMRRALEAQKAPDASLPARLSVDRVFTKKGAGTVCTGTLVAGSLASGMPISVVSRTGSRASSVRGLHLHDRAVSEVSAPTRLAINLASLGLDQIKRGDVITTAPGVRATTRLDAELSLSRKIAATAELEVYVGTARAIGRLQLFEQTSEEHPERRNLARLRLSSPLVVSGGDRVVLRASSDKRQKSGAVVGGGVVLDARPPPIRSRKKRLDVLAALAEKDMAALALALSEERAPRPLTFSELEDRFGVPGPALLRALDKLADRGDVVRLKDEGVISRAALLVLAQRARALTAQHHASHPMDRGIALETLRRKLAERAGMAAAAEAIRLAGRKTLPGDALMVAGDVARLDGFVEGGESRAGGPLDTARRALDDAAEKGLGEFALTELLAVPPKEAKSVLAKLVRDGDAVAAGGQWFARTPVDRLRSSVVSHLNAKKVLTIAEFKEISGLGRKQAIPLLELFDREGTTMRKGDDRLLGPRAAPADEA